jgi:glucose-6-phosphate dehydrogenase assembly protein OpcA
MNESPSPRGGDVTFAEIEAAIARPYLSERKAARLALTATVVVVSPPDRLPEAAAALDGLTDIGVRAVLISYGTNDSPPVRVSERTVTLEGLRQEYLNNAVAALRLSSLPTLVWWRGGAAAESLDGLANLADRLVLDAPDPRDVWRRLPALASRVNVSDLRWTRLTRWRALMAHFFDMPDVQASLQHFTRLRVAGADPHCARLYAGWLLSAMKCERPPRVEIQGGGSGAVERVELGAEGLSLTLDLSGGGTCVETSAEKKGGASASRIVWLGDQGLATFLGEELRIRARDLAFERAVAAAEDIV